MKKNSTKAIHTSATNALKSKLLTYTATVKDEKTGETEQVTRPIFLVTSRKTGEIMVHPVFLYEYAVMKDHYVYLRNDALGSEIKYIYEGGVYKCVNDYDIKRKLHDYVRDERPDLQNPFAANQALEMLNSKALRIKYDRTNSNESWINFTNGLLDLKTMQLLPHTPNFYSTIQIPCDWSEPAATNTPVFDKFLQTLTNYDESKAKLLLQYMGAVISNIQGYKFKKALFLVGGGNTGKSRFIELLTKLLGDENYSEQSLQRLSERFRETAVFGKRLVFSSDMSFVKIEQMTRFKELTGGDKISIEYKNKDPFHYCFPGLLLFSMNALPKFGGDKGDHVYERMLILKCNNVIPEDGRDVHPADKMYAERGGIVKKCVKSLLEAVKGGYRFDVPDECAANISDYKEQNSSVAEFWKECMESCAVGTTCVNTSMQVYTLYRKWAEQNGLRYISSMPEFRGEVAAYLDEKWDSLTHRRNSAVYLKEWQFSEDGRNLTASE